MKIDIYILINYIIEKYIMYRSKNVVYLDVRCSDSCAIIVQIPLYNISCTIRCMIFSTVIREKKNVQEKKRQEKSC